MKALEISGRVEGKKTGTGWQAKCPAHDDKVASLSISEAEDGKVLLHCHAGCDPKAILDKLGLTFADLDNELKVTTGRRVVAEYDYRDEKGVLRYQAVRYDPKGFAQRQPDGAGGWTWKMDGVEPLPYNLPAVITAIAAGKTIFIVEGEKDVQSLAKIGLVGTTNHGGADKWKRQLNPYFANANVCVLPDNDEPGKRHARVIESVLTGIAASVHIVMLPGLPAKGDVTDWIEQGGTADELIDLTRPPKKIIWTRDEATALLRARLRKKSFFLDKAALPMPFKNMVSFGGYASAIPPRKMLAIIASSGDGKTTITETIIDHWAKAGYNGIFWGPEWSAEELTTRALQRLGGASLMTFQSDQEWQAAAARFVPENKRPGQPMSEDTIVHNEKLLAEIDAWPGEMFYVDKMSLDIDELLKHFSTILQQTRRDGISMNYVVVDYAQLLESDGEKEHDRIDRALSKLKGFVVDNDLVAVVSSQITKADSRAGGEGKAPGLEAMMNARSDKFNLAFTLSRSQGANGKKSPNAKVRIVKNSMGSTGETELVLDVKRMCWGDAKLVNVNLRDELPPPIHLPSAAK